MAEPEFPHPDNPSAQACWDGHDATDASSTPLTLEEIRKAVYELYGVRPPSSVDVWEHQGTFGGIDVFWNPRIGTYLAVDPARRTDDEA